MLHKVDHLKRYTKELLSAKKVQQRITAKRSVSDETCSVLVERELPYPPPSKRNFVRNALAEITAYSTLTGMIHPVYALHVSEKSLKKNEREREKKRETYLFTSGISRNRADATSSLKATTRRRAPG